MFPFADPFPPHFRQLLRNVHLTFKKQQRNTRFRPPCCWNCYVFLPLAPLSDLLFPSISPLPTIVLNYSIANYSPQLLLKASTLYSELSAPEKRSYYNYSQPNVRLVNVLEDPRNCLHRVWKCRLTTQSRSFSDFNQHNGKGSQMLT